MPQRDRILGVFAKWPTPGAVKTRLAAARGVEFATAAAMAFLGDVLERYGAFSARRILAYSPAEARDDFVEVAGADWELAPQRSGGLGARMRAFFEAFLSPDAAVVLLGADSPTLPIDFVEHAFAALDQHDIVLGPATDGGYYLVGGAASMPLVIFDQPVFSRCDVFSQTIASLPPQARLALLAPWYDVDAEGDWEMLCGHVAALRRAGIDPGAPRTERLCGLM